MQAQYDICKESIDNLLSYIRKERERPSNDSYEYTKEQPTKYELNNITFNRDNRAAKVFFTGTKLYRTIERYITRNYVRYPIYSFWKTKTTSLTKSIKLTNNALEGLMAHEDKLIRDFAPDIVAALDDYSLLPSWFIKKLISNDYRIKIKSLNEQFKSKHELYDKAQKDMNDKVDELNIQNAYCEKRRFITAHKIKKVSYTISKIENRKKSILLTLITLGVYYYANSKKRKGRLIQKKNNLESLLASQDNNITMLNKALNDCRTIMKAEEEAHTLYTRDFKLHIERLQLDCDLLKGNVSPLLTTHEEAKDFLPLKDFNGLNYEKIVGCYVIRNTEKDKYYIGQSKDVHKRIKQHFRGTTPNNIVFAEDYFNSTYEDKENIFDVKIIRLNTKDELDRTERELIESYGAKEFGYNGTNGNT